MLGYFPVGDVEVERVLIVHTEMEQDDVQAQMDSMDARGLTVDSDRVFALYCGSLQLDQSEDDRAYIQGRIRKVRPDLIILDSASNCVADTKSDETVRTFFNFLSDAMRRLGVKGCILTMHPRKRSQESRGKRKFDDLFGSREWKGRLSVAVWIAPGNTKRPEHLILWKHRGAQIAELWERNEGDQSRMLTLTRPGVENGNVPPFKIMGGGRAALLEGKAVALVRAQPDRYTKSGLADAVGGQRQVALAVIDNLLRAGRIGPNEPRAKLRVLD